MAALFKLLFAVHESGSWHLPTVSAACRYFRI